MTVQTARNLIVTLDEVEAAARHSLNNFGYAPRLAATLAQVIRLAERDGPASHGLAMLGRYKACAESGKITLAPRPRYHTVRPSIMVVDCDNSFAPYATALARDSFIDLVRKQGSATLTTRNAYHISALRHDVIPLAEAGLIAITMSGTLPWVVPHGGRDPVFGTNPMAFACPRPDGPPIAWDQATSIQSISDVRLAAKEGRPLETPVGLGRDGQPTRKPEEIIETRRMLPFGGHKGTAIALMIEIMTTGLTGGRFAVEYRGADDAPAAAAGQLMIAIDPDAVEPTFVERLRVLLEAMDGNGAARVPGDGRLARRKAAEGEGVRISGALQEQLQALGWSPLDR